MVQAVRWHGDRVDLLDQRLLPEEVKYVACKTFQEVAASIRDMVVRGAPAIGIAGAYGMALAVKDAAEAADPLSFVEKARLQLISARPTAVNLQWAVDRVCKRVRPLLLKSEYLCQAAREAIDEALSIEAEDIETNQKIGEYGASLIKPGARILTHCNAGALATGGYGTALGVIRKAWEQGKVSMVYADETRPYLQGARLTVWELLQDGIDVTLLVDSAAAYLMAKGQVDYVIVGADRIAANGDVANKIGTYGLACLCAHHRIPFYVAAPTSTFDMTLESGRQIPIEERPPREILWFKDHLLAPSDTKVFNPAFDVTPSELISAIITERGVILPPLNRNVLALIMGDDGHA